MKGACQTLDIQNFIYIKLGWVYPIVAKLFEIMKKFMCTATIDYFLKRIWKEE